MLPIGRVLASGGSTAACNHDAFARHAGIQRRGCKMYERTHKRAFGTFASTFDLALRGLLARLPRAFGTWVRLRYLRRGQHPAQAGLSGAPSPGKPAERQTLELALHLLRDLTAELLGGPDAEARYQTASGETAP